jgi:hypothetical protein
MLLVLVKCGAPHGALQKETSYIDGRKHNRHESIIPPPVESCAEGRHVDVTTMLITGGMRHSLVKHARAQSPRLALNLIQKRVIVQPITPTSINLLGGYRLTGKR